MEFIFPKKEWHFGGGVGSKGIKDEKMLQKRLQFLGVFFLSFSFFWWGKGVYQLCNVCYDLHYGHFVFPALNSSRGICRGGQQH